MAREIKAGSWLFRISDDQKQLQRAPLGSSSYSSCWSAPGGERILDIMANGEDVAISTDRHDYIRRKSGGVFLK